MRFCASGTPLRSTMSPRGAGIERKSVRAFLSFFSEMGMPALGSVGGGRGRFFLPSSMTALTLMAGSSAGGGVLLVSFLGRSGRGACSAGWGSSGIMRGLIGGVSGISGGASGTGSGSSGMILGRGAGSVAAAGSSGMIRGTGGASVWPSRQEAPRSINQVRKRACIGQISCG